eukprot:jgi/Botrbrau1/2597/Bobra.145_1s0023.1
MATDLKRLGFIPAAAEYVYSKTLNAYGTYSKTLTPQFLQNQLLKPAESRVAEFASPVVASVQTGSLSLLANLDSKVDGTVSTMESMIKSALERWTALQSTGVAKFTDARSRALKTVQDFSKQVQKEGLLNSTAKIASEAVKPPVEFAKQTYVSVHDAVTASPYYHSAYDAGKVVLFRAQETSLYKGFAARVLPVISSVAGYELDAITKSQYYQVALQQLQPITIIKA